MLPYFLLWVVWTLQHKALRALHRKAEREVEKNRKTSEREAEKTETSKLNHLIFLANDWFQ